jgi:hypothetical protein
MMISAESRFGGMAGSLRATGSTRVVGGTDRAAVADLNIPESCIPEGREGSTLPRIRCARVEFGSSGLIVISRLD